MVGTNGGHNTFSRLAKTKGETEGEASSNTGKRSCNTGKGSCVEGNTGIDLSH